MNACYSPVFALLIDKSSADANLFLLSVGQHLLAGRGELVARLGQAGDDPSAARHGAFTEFLEVARAGFALRGGQLLRDGGLRGAQDGGDEDGA